MEDTNITNSSGFVFIWKIENFRILKYYKSPEFLSETLGCTKWELEFDASYCLQISRKDDGAEIELDLSFSCFTTCGKTLCQSEIETHKIKSSSKHTLKTGIERWESWLDLNRDLVIHCKLRQRDRKVSEWGYSYALTSPGRVEKKWNVNSKKPSTLYLESGNDDHPIFTLTAFPAKYSDYFHIDITTNKSQISRVYVTNLENNESNYLTRHFIPNIKHPFPNFIHKKPPRNLTLLCECWDFDSEFTTTEIKRGMLSEHKDLFKKCPFNPEIRKSGAQKTLDLNRGTSSSSNLQITGLSKDLLTFYTEKKLSDLTIRVEDRRFSVHKFILCARSDKFRRLLRNDDLETNSNSINNKPVKTLLVTDVRASTFERFLTLLYSDRLENIESDEEVVELYYAACKYEFEALKQKCHSLLKDFQLTTSNVCLVLELSVGLTDDPLGEKAEIFFSEHAKEIMNMSDVWVRFMQRVPLLASRLMHKFFLSMKDS